MPATIAQPHEDFTCPLQLCRCSPLCAPAPGPPRRAAFVDYHKHLGMTRRKKVVLGCGTGLLIAVGSCYVALHRAWLYEGGAIHDNGVISYPRFIAPFTPIPLNRPGTYSFKFKRFPANDAAVILNTPTGPRPESLETLTTRLSIHVEDQRGRLRCSATGFPAGPGAEQAFVTSAIRARGIWLTGCANVDVTGCDPCRVTITIGEVDAATPSIPIVPTLEGGGVELP